VCLVTALAALRRAPICPITCPNATHNLMRTSS